MDRYRVLVTIDVLQMRQPSATDRRLILAFLNALGPILFEREIFTSAILRAATFKLRSWAITL